MTGVDSETTVPPHVASGDGTRERCNTEKPTPSGPYTCTAEAGHDGPHAAYSSADHLCHAWPRDEAADRAAALAGTGLARPATPGEETCNAWTPFPGSICVAVDGHAGNHAAYGPDGELCTTWPQDQTMAELAGTGLVVPSGQAAELDYCQTHDGRCDPGYAAELDGTEQDPERAAYIIGLRKLAGILESNPAVPLPGGSGTDSLAPVLFGFYGSGAREELAAAVRAFPVRFAKDADGNWLNLNGKLAGLHVQLYASREQVCTRRVVGTEEREVEEIVTPAVTEKRTETVEVVEWDCAPVLAPRQDGAS